MKTHAFPTLVQPRDERTQPARIIKGYPQTPWRNPREPLVDVDRDVYALTVKKRMVQCCASPGQGP